MLCRPFGGGVETRFVCKKKRRENLLSKTVMLVQWWLVICEAAFEPLYCLPQNWKIFLELIEENSHESWKSSYPGMTGVTCCRPCKLLNI